MRAYARAFWPSELHVHEYARACAHVQGGALVEGYIDGLEVKTWLHFKQKTSVGECSFIDLLAAAIQI